MMSGPSSSSFAITAIPGRGNGLLATRLIHKGELIFTEKPAIWHSRSKTDGFCSSCGKLIQRESVRCHSACAASDGTSSNGNSNSNSNSNCNNDSSDKSNSSSSSNSNKANSNNSNSNDSNRNNASDSSNNNCQAVYCSSKCRDNDDFCGHRWLCGDGAAAKVKVRVRVRLSVS
jgi:hypothetical protein